MDLVDRVLAGERLALARLLTQVENDTPLGRTALDRLFEHGGKAHLVGITGAPGTGKSSLTNRLVQRFRADGYKVAVIAVDPSSPFTGGALLGDRLRMKDAAMDRGVFIRSMASRGVLGGLARATAGMAEVLDAAGFELILIETVGAGQSEVDIARLAHTVVVVEAPGLGDDIQAIKAGILEIADILVVNKADLPGVENTQRALNAMLEIAYHDGTSTSWRPPLLKAIASTGEGVAELADSILAHARFLRETGGWQARSRERVTIGFLDLLRSTLWERWKADIGEERLEQTLKRISRREITPGAALEDFLRAR